MRHLRGPIDSDGERIPLTERQRSNVKTWIAALRSGVYAQGKEALIVDGTYCCLGVAAMPAVCEVSVGKHGIYVPPVLLDSDEAKEKLGLAGPDQTALARLNDEEGLTFSQIADILERELLGPIDAPQTNGEGNES